MSKMQIFIVVAVIAIAIVYLVMSTRSTKGSVAPEIQATLTTGESFRLSELKGNFVLIEFWGSWCGPCLREAPEVVKLYNEYKSVQIKGDVGFEMVSIALEKSNKRWESTAKRLGYNWQYQIVDVSPIVLMSQYARDYGVTSIPHHVLVNPEGIIVGNNISFAEIRKILEQAK